MAINLLNRTIRFFISQLNTLAIGFLITHIQSIVVRVAKQGIRLITGLFGILDISGAKSSADRLCFLVGRMPEIPFEVVILLDVALLVFDITCVGFIHMPLFNLLIRS